MAEVRDLQVGDIIRIRQAIQLIPLEEGIPAEIPAGTLATIVDVVLFDAEDLQYQVVFSDEMAHFNDIYLSADFFDLMFRFSLN